MPDDDNITDNVTLHDAASNPVGVVLKNGIYRLEGRSILTSPDGTKDVDVVTDINAIERLAVDAFLTGGNFQLQPYVPLTTFDSTGVTITSAGWTTLLTKTSQEGKLDFIACVGGSSGYRIRLTVDAIEVFDVTMSDLNAIGLANATNVPIWAETANKNFRYHPNQEVDYTDSLLIEAQATGADVLLQSLINHREIS